MKLPPYEIPAGDSDLMLNGVNLANESIDRFEILCLEFVSPGNLRVLLDIMSNPGSSRRDVADRLEIRTGNIAHHIEILERKGFLDCTQHRGERTQYRWCVSTRHPLMKATFG